MIFQSYTDHSSESIYLEYMSFTLKTFAIAWRVEIPLQQGFYYAYSFI